MRLDHKIIEDIVTTGANVIDLGCGDGELIARLEREKNANVQGIEINESEIYKCVEKGLSVLHSNIDEGLRGFPDNIFDYVILNQSMQEVKKVEYVVDEAFRVGKKIIIGFPNFANISSRFQLFFGGYSPVTQALPYRWYDTPNIRFLSIADFRKFCAKKNIRIIQSFYLGKNSLVRCLPNLFARNAVFVIEKA